MTILSASGVPAGPLFYVVGGFVLLIAGVVLATNFRGLAERYVRLGLPSRDRAEANVSRYRTYYGVGAAVGLVMLVSGLLQLVG